MTPEKSIVKLPFWPFILASTLLLAAAAVVFKLAHQPLQLWEAGAIVIFVGGSAWSFLIPFLRRNADNQALSQADSIAASLAQINKIDQVAGQITNATAQWQSVHGHATQIAETSKELAGSISKEAKSFAEFLQKANDSEKAHLRLEIEKLRRTEIECVQVLTHFLDHTFALMSGAQKSGQRNLIEQIGQFQNACLDVARRVGLAPIVPAPGEPFDERVHQWAEEGKKPEANARIKGTLVSGYGYQGQLIRRAVVALQTNEETPATPETNA